MWIISVCIPKPRQGIQSTHSCISDIVTSKRHYCFGNFTNRCILFTICVCCIHPYCLKNSLSIYFNKISIISAAVNRWIYTQLHTHTHTHPFNGRFSGTTPVSRYQKGETNLDFTEARDSECQWHQVGHMQVCTSLQADNHASTPTLSFLQAGCPSCHLNNSVKALKAIFTLC